MAVPVIRKLLKELPNEDHLVDCPPGTSCNVVTALKYADAAILVTEPSEFGLHDLKMALELVKLYDIPYGIVINKDDGLDNMVKTFCRKNKVALLGTVPYSMEAAALYSKGMMLCEDDNHKENFIEIAQKIKEAFTW
jgi:MinD superfamily P-loop ATPase